MISIFIESALFLMPLPSFDYNYFENKAKVNK